MAISARADGEETGVDHRLLEAHLESCARCRAFSVAVGGGRRRLMVQEAVAMPDLSHRVSKLMAAADRASRSIVVRVLLLVAAAEVIVSALPALLNGHDHDGRHLGAFSVAYGVALVVAAVRPARARTVLPVSVVLAAALVITAIVDLARGVVPLIDEAAHIPELLSVVLVWILTVPKPTRGRGLEARRPAAAPALRAVPDQQAPDRRAV